MRLMGKEGRFVWSENRAELQTVPLVENRRTVEICKAKVNSSPDLHASQSNPVWRKF